MASSRYPFLASYRFDRCFHRYAYSFSPLSLFFSCIFSMNHAQVFEQLLSSELVIVLYNLLQHHACGETHKVCTQLLVCIVRVRRYIVAKRVNIMKSDLLLTMMRSGLRQTAVNGAGNVVHLDALSLPT